MELRKKKIRLIYRSNGYFIYKEQQNTIKQVKKKILQVSQKFNKFNSGS